MALVNGCNLPEELYYLVDKHTWLRMETEGTVAIGLSDVAQNMAKSIISVTARKAGRKVDKGQSLATVESGKFVGPVPAPVAGEVVAINEQLMAKPALINEDPYGQGWIAKMKPSDWEGDKSTLVTGAEGLESYRQYLDSQGIKCE
ncbi:MAG: glycine cleavage system protein GcvH [Dehalococcoidia bacterium]